MGLVMRDDEHMREIAALVQYANLHNQAPLTEEELWFIYYYPETARDLLTVEL